MSRVDLSPECRCVEDESAPIAADEHELQDASRRRNVDSIRACFERSDETENLDQNLGR